jgi:hypothetical protein
MKVSELIAELKNYEGCEGFPDTDPMALRTGGNLDKAKRKVERDVLIKTMRTKTIPQYHSEYEIYVQYGDVVIETEHLLPSSRRRKK